VGASDVPTLAFNTSECSEVANADKIFVDYQGVTDVLVDTSDYSFSPLVFEDLQSYNPIGIPCLARNDYSFGP